MKKRIMILAVASITLIGCKKENTENVVTPSDTLVIDSTETKNNTASDTNVSETNLSWEGKYVGMIPCVSCDGIEATLELKTDMTYTASSMFTERDKKPVDINGSFTWIEENKTLQLDTAGDNRKFEISTNGIIPLDRDGKRFSIPENSGIPHNGEYLLIKK